MVIWVHNFILLEVELEVEYKWNISITDENGI